MVTKFLKLFILVGVLGIHTGCLKMSEDSGETYGDKSPSESVSDSKNNNRGLVGVVSFVPSKQTDASRYLDLDFDTLKIYSSHTSYGVYNYSKNRLLKIQT